MGFIYNGTDRYTYVRNALGEICEILDTKGDITITYKYDAYGYIKEITGKTAYIDTIGKLQPLKYKGYINDEETGYYYLQSRYYSPFLKRFISLDDTGILEATKGEILGANLYAYCNNNPTMNEDPSGYLPRWRHLLKGIRLLTLGMIALISCIWKGFVRSALGALTAKFVGFLAGSVLAMLPLGQYWGVIINVAIIVSIIWRVRSIVRNIPLGLWHIRQFVKHTHR